MNNLFNINEKIIAVIPARGGSKGLQRKNIINLNGKPLISYTISAALKSKYVDRVFVSTEDSEIKSVSLKARCEVIDRPVELAQDVSSTYDVINHLIEKLKSRNYFADIIILLQPTSPLRDVNDINSSIKTFYESSSESLISFSETEHSPFWSFQKSNEKMIPLFGLDFLKSRRQDLPKTFLPNGAIYISSVDNFKKNKGFYCNDIVPYIMSREKSIDIDSKADLIMCEYFLRNSYKKKFR